MTDNQKQDIRYKLFSDICNQTVTAKLTACSDGVVYGLKIATEEAERLGLSLFTAVKDGMHINKGEVILTATGNSIQIAMAEDILIGSISKPSGVATAAAKAMEESRGKPIIVCGSFKKLPLSERQELRHAVMTAGIMPRIANPPFVYLDKNYVRMFGGVTQAVSAAKKLDGYTVVVQLKGICGSVADEAREAIVSGADILMIDTGNEKDIDTVNSILEELNLRKLVKVAFAGDVKIGDIVRLREKNLDMICIGRDIIDAPMLDLKFDVIDTEKQDDNAISLNLMEKSELWIEDIYLDNVNLNQLSDIASEVLDIPRKDLLVVDVRNDHITFDILSHRADAASITGKEQELMHRFAQVEGVRLGENAGVHSNGILGLIAVNPTESQEIINSMRNMSKQLEDTISKRIMVYPTGFELEKSMIEDTNSPYIAGRLRELGYEVCIGSPISDDAGAIAKAVSDAWEQGYGLVITSGGVGAEDKDHTVEGLMELDPDAAIAWLVKFRKASGRHVKDGVRIACAQLGGAMAVSFPGPNDEVRLATEALIGALGHNCNKYAIAQAIAEVLREKLKDSLICYEH